MPLPSFIMKAASGLGKVARAPGKVVAGRASTRIPLGMGVGGLAGYIGSDSNTAEGQIRDALGGALIGGAIGFGLSKPFWKGVGKTAKGIGGLTPMGRAYKRGRGAAVEEFRSARIASSTNRSEKHLLSMYRNKLQPKGVARARVEARGALSAIGATGRMGMKAGKGALGFALNNPQLAAVGAATGLAMGLAPGGLETSSPGYAAAQYGSQYMTPEQQGRTILQSSTENLVQGLNARRHS